LESKSTRSDPANPTGGARPPSSSATTTHPPCFDTNGLPSCDTLTFSREQKQRAWNLVRPS
jgi:hypothetical protein